MARLIYGRRALDDIERLFEAIPDEESARRAVEAMRSAIEMLAHHPLIGRIVEGELRELVISYGKTGYLALYRFVAVHDEVRVLALRHQRELDYP